MDVSCVMGHMSYIMCHLLFVLCSVSHATCRILPVICRLSLVTCHYLQQQQPQTFPLPTPSLCKVSWFTKNKNPQKAFKTQICPNMLKKNTIF